MMNKFSIITILTAILLFMISCDWFAEDLGPDEYFYLENKSNETIYSFYRIYTSGEITISPIDVLHYPWDTITVNYSHQYGVYGKNQMIEILVLKESTMKKYSSNDFLDQIIFDKQYKFSYDDLKEKDFKVVYTDL